MSTNHLDESERIRIGAGHEADVLRLIGAVAATEKDDIEKKIDGWIRWSGRMWSVQVKWRETGNDLGIACIRPYVDQATFISQFVEDELPLDRDLKHRPDLYAFASPPHCLVVTGLDVHSLCWEALNLLAAQERGFVRNLFWVRDGLELRLVTDQGAQGYSAGQRKVICYISKGLLMRDAMGHWTFE